MDKETILFNVRVAAWNLKGAAQNIVNACQINGSLKNMGLVEHDINRILARVDQQLAEIKGCRRELVRARYQLRKQNDGNTSDSDCSDSSR